MTVPAASGAMTTEHAVRWSGCWIIALVSRSSGSAIVLIDRLVPRRRLDGRGRHRPLYDVLLIVSVPIFVLVMAVAHLLRVRSSAPSPATCSDGAPIHGNTRLEVVWVTIPFLIVTALAVYGWVVLDDIEEKQADEMVVNVTGQQFAWSFDYPEGGKKVKCNELVLPEGPAGRLPDPHARTCSTPSGSRSSA